MNLRTDTWKSFYLKDLYVVKMGNGFDKNKMTDEMQVLILCPVLAIIMVLTVRWIY